MSVKGVLIPSHAFDILSEMVFSVIRTGPVIAILRWIKQV